MKKRMIVFIGATIIEVAIACFLGIDIKDSLWIVIVGNLLAAQFADMVYKKKIFK